MRYPSFHRVRGSGNRSSRRRLGVAVFAAIVLFSHCKSPSSGNAPSNPHQVNATQNTTRPPPPGVARTVADSTPEVYAVGNVVRLLRFYIPFDDYLCPVKGMLICNPSLGPVIDYAGELSLQAKWQKYGLSINGKPAYIDVSKTSELLLRHLLKQQGTGTVALQIHAVDSEFQMLRRALSSGQTGNFVFKVSGQHQAVLRSLASIKGLIDKVSGLVLTGPKDQRTVIDLQAVRDEIPRFRKLTALVLDGLSVPSGSYSGLLALSRLGYFSCMGCDLRGDILLPGSVRSLELPGTAIASGAARKMLEGKSLKVFIAPNRISGRSLTALLAKQREIETLDIGGLGDNQVGDLSLRGLPKLRCLFAGKPTLNDGNFQSLSGMKSLLMLDLSSTGVTSKVFSSFPGGSDLRVLKLSNSDVDDSVAQVLRRSPNLRVLQVSAVRKDLARVSRKTLDTLLGLRKLVELQTCLKDATDADIEKLSRLTNLEILHLECAEVSDRLVTAIAKLRKLRILSIGGKGITNNSVPALLSLRNLVVLKLPYTSINDKGLMALSKLDNLQVIDIGGSNVTEKGKRAFKAARPQCEFSED